MLEKGYHSSIFLGGKDPNHTDVSVPHDTTIDGKLDPVRDLYSMKQMLNHHFVRKQFVDAQGEKRVKAEKRKEKLKDNAKRAFLELMMKQSSLTKV